MMHFYEKLNQKDVYHFKFSQFKFLAITKWDLKLELPSL